MGFREIVGAICWTSRQETVPEGIYGVPCLDAWKGV